MFSLIPLAVLFTLTAVVAGRYHAQEASLARHWFLSGETHLNGGAPDLAVEDFRTALAYDPGNNSTQLRLAEALLAAGRISEAHAYFLTLWDRMPGSGEINLELARISARNGEVEEAARYYRNAINGVWEARSAELRKTVRLELCEYLLAHGQLNEARAEIAAVAAEASPEDAATHESAGALFLRAGSPAQALPEFEAALRIVPAEGQWLEETGQTAFELGNYFKAEIYLSRSAHQHRSEQVTKLLETVRALLRSDPYEPGLSDAEQARRSWLAFGQGWKRLQGCLEASSKNPSTHAATSNLIDLAKQATSVRSRITLRLLREQPALRDSAMRLVFQIEQSAGLMCGAPSGQDEVLNLIGKQHFNGES